MNWVSPELAGLPRPLCFEALEALPHEVYREVERRSTRRVCLFGVECFVKLHRGVGWMQILGDLARLRRPVFGAAAEVRAIARLQAAGVGVARVLAWGSHGWNPARRRSYVVLQSLAAAISLEQLAEAGVDSTTRRRLCMRAADVVRRMHAAGVNHRDLYLCHLLASPERDELLVLDLHRAQVRARVPRRWRIKDLASLLYSSTDLGLSRRDQLRFVVRYTRGPARGLRRDSGFWRAVRRRAAAMSRRERRLGVRDTAGQAMPAP